MIDMRVINPPREDPDQSWIKLRVTWHDSSKGRGDQVHSVEERFPEDMPIGKAVEIAEQLAAQQFGGLILAGKAG